MTRATQKNIAIAFAELCDVFDIPCALKTDGSWVPFSWNIPAVKDDVTHEGAMHGAQGFDTLANGKLSFFGYAPNTSGHSSPHPVLIACGIPRDTWAQMTKREAYDRITAALGAARMAKMEATSDDLKAIR